MRKNDKRTRKRRQRTRVRTRSQEPRITANVALENASPTTQNGLVHETTQGMETEYLFQQYYKVTVDERLIDRHLDRVQTEKKEWIEFERVMFKRMFRAIQSSPHVLHDICVYQVLAEQESMGGETYTEGYYGEEKYFAQLLAEHASCFASQDRAWLLDLIQRYQRTQVRIAPGMQMEDYQMSDLFDLDVQVEALQEAFHVEPSGFTVGQHACRLKE